MHIRSAIVDFDGTACAVDVASAMCETFAAGDWRLFDDAVARGELSLRAAIGTQARMLSASREEMLTFALQHFRVDPTFVAFAHWAAAEGVDVTVVSDGFGFYIAPMLAAAGLVRLPILANELRGEPGRLWLDHPFGHPECAGCGTCKMRAVAAARATRGPVAFIGEGESDRFGALFADIVFAKDRLAVLCAAAGIRYAPWTDFADVRDHVARFTAARETAGTAPPPCPGWTPYAATDREVRA